MSLSDSSLQAAQKKSIELLTISIATLSMTLGVDQEELNDSFEIPVAEEDPKYKSYQSLISMKNNLKKLES